MTKKVKTGASCMKICILDYGSGNVRSVFNIFSSICHEVIVSNDHEDIKSCSHIVLPGVGSFGTAMEKIKQRIDIEKLEQEVLVNKKPFLGICVGMQVLADIGFEFGSYKGLGWISGTVRKISSAGMPLPHVGWNNVFKSQNHPLIWGLPSEPDFYFVHSYCFEPENPACIVGMSQYGEEFPSIIAKENILGVQFHPEKSQKAGLMLIEAFLNIQKAKK